MAGAGNSCLPVPELRSGFQKKNNGRCESAARIEERTVEIQSGNLENGHASSSTWDYSNICVTMYLYSRGNIEHLTELSMSKWEVAKFDMAASQLV